MKIKVFVVSKWNKIITGGQKYEKMLFSLINRIPGFSLEEIAIGASEKTPFLLKPFIEFYNGTKNKEADIIIFNSTRCLRFFPLLLLLKFIFRKKIYTTHHHFMYHSFHGLKKLVFKISEISFLKLSNKIIVPSPYIYERLKRIKSENDLLLWRIPFDTSSEIEPCPVPGNLTYIGTIEERKGLIFLFNALKKLQDNGVEYNLNIIGKPTEEKYYSDLKKYAETNSLKVNFLGFIESNEKEKILSTSDIFVFPSMLEGYGMVLVEAQVYALPIVCFNISAMPFTVKNNINGFTVPPFDIDILADRLEELIKDRDLRNKLSRGAIENLKEQWTQQKFDTTVLNYFESINKSGKDRELD